MALRAWVLTNLIVNGIILIAHVVRFEFNAFLCFLREVKMTGPKAREAYRALRVSEKLRYRYEAIRRNKEIDKEKEVVDEKIRNYAKVGPLGSMDRGNVLDFVELKGLLDAPNSYLAERFKTKNIYPWARSLDGVMPTYTQSSHAALALPRIILPGGACRGCAQERVKSMKKVSKCRHAIKTKFAEFNALGQGLSVALITKTKTFSFNIHILSLWINNLFFRDGNFTGRDPPLAMVLLWRG